MQLARPIVVEYLAEHARMPIKEVFANQRVIISNRFVKSGQFSSGNFLERRLASERVLLMMLVLMLMFGKG